MTERPTEPFTDPLTERRIEARGLTKTFGTVTAVRDLSFTVEPGSVTGFLGPNGAGKSTTLRMLLGLVIPDAGTATIGGRAYTALPAPTSVVGAVLEATSFHPARCGRDHLRVYCTASGHPPARADEVLDMVGLASAGRRPVRGYSLGMRQRLALATALLGDPAVLLLDEPANGLDPEGIAWLRRLLRELASQHRTVLVSSHLLSEMQQLVDRVVIVCRGRLVGHGTLDELTARQAHVVSVSTPQVERFHAALREAAPAHVRLERVGSQRLRITGMAAAEIGDLACAERVVLHELATTPGDLEQAFLGLTSAGGTG